MMCVCAIFGDSSRCDVEVRCKYCMAVVCTERVVQRVRDKAIQHYLLLLARTRH